MKTIPTVDDSPGVTLVTNDTRKIKRAKRDDVSVDDVLKELISNFTDDDGDDEMYAEVIEYMKMYRYGGKNSSIFPQLSCLALPLISIPASSTTSQRVFSETGRVPEARRQQSNPDSLDSLLFLRNFR